MKESMYEEVSLNQSTNSDRESRRSHNSSILTSSSASERSNSRSSSLNKSIDSSDEFENDKPIKVENVLEDECRAKTPPISNKLKQKVQKAGFDHSTPNLNIYNHNLHKYAMNHQVNNSLSNVIDKISKYSKEKRLHTSSQQAQAASEIYGSQMALSNQQKPVSVCSVCGDRASGKHYGVLSCDGCRGFFKRSIRGNMEYVCKESNKCVIDVSRRNQCQACRLKKCLEVKMNRDAVQHQRPPRTHQMKRELANSHSFSAAPQSQPAQTHDLDKMLSNQASYEQQSRAAYYSNRFSPYGNSYQMAKSARQSKYACPPNQTNWALPASDSNFLNEKSPNLNYYNSPIGHLQPFQNSDFLAGYKNPMAAFSAFKNISLNISENAAPAYLSNLSSGYCSLDEKNMSNLSSPSAIADSAKLNSSASLAHIMNWIRSTPSEENLVEVTSRILYSAIKWTKTQRNFLSLPLADQKCLIYENISELYILQMAETKSASNEIFLLAENEKNQEKKMIYQSFQQILQKFHMDKVDPLEFYLLKSISLFKSNSNEIEEKAKIEKIQEECFISLFNYTKLNYPSCPRFGRLLILYTDLRKYTSKIVEELVFQNILGKKDLHGYIDELILKS